MCVCSTAGAGVAHVQLYICRPARRSVCAIDGGLARNDCGRHAISCAAAGNGADEQLLMGTGVRTSSPFKFQISSLESPQLVSVHDSIVNLLLLESYFSRIVCKL